MNQLTFYTHPKPWRTEFADLQHAAVRSLIKIVGADHVVLLGDDQGTADAAATLGVQHRGGIERNEWGTPLVSDIVRLVRDECPTELACLINADIVLGADFMPTVDAAAHVAAHHGPEGWLLIGQRTDTDVPDLAGLSTEAIRRRALAHGTLHGINGIDYFVFPRRTFEFVYPFALGKFAWDQWLVGNAFRRGLVCVDATPTVLAVHLNAPWFFRGQPETSREKIHASAEGLRNRDFDYYQRNVANGTTHVARRNHDGTIVVLGRPYLGGP